jgi:hypothetical protein
MAQIRVKQLVELVDMLSLQRKLLLLSWLTENHPQAVARGLERDSEPLFGARVESLALQEVVDDAAAVPML